MADYTLKNIPRDLYQRIESAAEEGFRSINQEILFRLSRSFDAQDAKVSALHARWIHEAFESGPPTPLTAGDLDAAFKRGIKRSKARRTSKAA